MGVLLRAIENNIAEIAQVDPELAERASGRNEFEEFSRRYGSCPCSLPGNAMAA